MDVTLTFRRKDLNRFFLSLVGFSLLLIAAFFFGRLIGSPIWFFERLVNIDDGNRFPAWLSSIIQL
jgi:hypothetical protein